MTKLSRALRNITYSAIGTMLAKIESFWALINLLTGNSVVNNSNITFMDIIQSAIIFLLLIWVVYQYFRFNRKLEILKTILNARGRNLYLEATKNIEIFQLPNQKPEDVYTKDKRYNDLLNSERLIVLRNVRKKYSNYTDKELKRMINEFYPLSRKQK